MTATPCADPEQAVRRHILLVEDDEACAGAYGRILRNAGFVVSIATDFRLALEILEADSPLDLMLCDIVMPGSVNGIALSRMARLRRSNLKILYVSGYSIPGVEQQGLGPILRKPIDEAKLLSEVEHALANDPDASTK